MNSSPSILRALWKHSLTNFVGILLLGALCATALQDYKTAGLLLGLALFNAALSYFQSREQTIHVHHTPTLVHIARTLHTPASALKTDATFILNYLAGRALIAGVLLGVIARGFGLNGHDAVLLGISIGAAVLPSGFLAERILSNNLSSSRLSFINSCKALRCTLTNNASEIILILASLGLALWFDIPQAITVIQILAIDIIAQILPIAALAYDRVQKHEAHARIGSLRHILEDEIMIKEFIAFGALTAGLAYANFWLFFSRHGLSAEYITQNSEVYFRATSLTLLTVVLCQFANIMFVRANAHEKFFTSYLTSNKLLLWAFGVSFFFILSIMYNPVVRPLFKTGPLEFGDWCMALLAAVIYVIVRLTQRHTRLHTRKAVLSLHRQLRG